MLMHPPKIALVLALHWVLGLAAIIPPVWAQRPADREDDADVRLPALVVDGAAEAARSRECAALQAQIDRWKMVRFGENEVLGGELAARLASRISELEYDCGLSDAQSQKLELAGRGDIKRFLDRLAEIGRDIASQRTHPDVAHAAAIVELNALDEWLGSGIFSTGSLFDKTLRGILPDGPEHDRYEETLKRKNVARYRRAVREWTLSLQRGLKLANSQCSELWELILAETSPPRRFGQSDFAMVYYQLSNVPEEKLRAILTDSQWKQVKVGISAGSNARALLGREGFEFAPDPVRPRAAQAPPPEPRPGDKPTAPGRR